MKYGWRQRRAPIKHMVEISMDKSHPEVDRLIKKYWKQNKKISVILAYLKIVHKVRVGMTWLKKRCRELGLYRRGPNITYHPVAIVQQAIEEELKGCNSNIGYRQMWCVLKDKHELVVKRSTVQMLMSVLDGDGVRRRLGRRLKKRVYQNKGPDFVWHLDGYDKLKPYGFCIHGCMDGYSRNIIWLELASTNNDPNVILLYYLLAILKKNGCPTILRSDCGTENTALATCHMTMRHNHDDGFRGCRSFRFGSSTTNTRIESWWSQLRNSVTDYWINVFKDLIDKGCLNPNDMIHRHCLCYVYAPMLQNALNDFQRRWNSHRIRQNRTAGCPAGVPEDLYELPQLTGTRSYRKTLDYEVWSNFYIENAYKPPPFYPPEFEDAADVILESIQLTRNNISLSNAETVYMYLCDTFSH